MSLMLEKQRISSELDAYIKGRHDADKVKLATVCKMTVGLAISFRELLKTLTAFRQELTVLVGKKNMNRLFHHSAGQLDKILAKGIERCTKPAENEEGLAHGIKKAPSTTVKDWNRNSGHTEFIVNGKAFKEKTATIENIQTFLQQSGIANEHIRDFLCDYFNQDGLLGMGHAFGMVVGNETGMVPSFSGAYHEIKTVSSRSVACLDRAEFSSLISLKTSTVTKLANPLQFITTFILVDDGRNVQMSDVEYAIGNLNAVAKDLQPKIQAAITKINSLT